MSPRDDRRTAAVVGAGTMGTGIAYTLAVAGWDVALADADAELAASGVARVGALIDDGVRRGKLTRDAGDAARRRLATVAGVDAIEPGLELAIEAAPEREPIKRTVLSRLEAREPQVLATNTSGISIDRLARSLNAPDRFLGMHFFNPVPAMPLVEVVRGTATAERTVTAAVELVAALGKEAIVVADAPGFATSRLGLALGLEAIRMVEQGVATAVDIDRAMELGYRHPMGPLRLTDLVGLDVRLDIARGLAEAYGPRFEPPALLESMVAEGRLGKKSGWGFYRWT